MFEEAQEQIRYEQQQIFRQMNGDGPLIATPPDTEPDNGNGCVVP